MTTTSSNFEHLQTLSTIKFTAQQSCLDWILDSKHSSAAQFVLSLDPVLFTSRKLMQALVASEENHPLFSTFTVKIILDLVERKDGVSKNSLLQTLTLPGTSKNFVTLLVKIKQHGYKFLLENIKDIATEMKKANEEYKQNLSAMNSNPKKSKQKRTDFFVNNHSTEKSNKKVKIEDNNSMELDNDNSSKRKT